MLGSLQKISAETIFKYSNENHEPYDKDIHCFQTKTEQLQAYLKINRKYIANHNGKTSRREG